MELSTIGNTIYPGREVMLYCDMYARDFTPQANGKRFQIVHVKEGFGILKLDNKHQIISAPSVLCLNEKDYPQWAETNDLKLEIVYFEPSAYHESFHFNYAWTDEDGRYGYDSWLFRPFILRDDQYIGAAKADWFSSRKMSRLMQQIDEELKFQPDSFWPCRSRSFLAELIIMVSNLFENYKSCLKMTLTALPEDMQKIISYLHAYYHERISLQSLVIQFHSNKTTLNSKFKSLTGYSLMDYLNHLRIDIACSLLRNTDLTVNEIMTRVGFKDHAHFGRIFKKYTHASPSQYRVTTGI